MAVLAAERIDRPPSLFAPAAPAERIRAQARRSALGGGLTLDEAIVGAWEGLAAQVVAACPLCGGELRARPAGRDGAVHGECRECGTTLS